MNEDQTLPVELTDLEKEAFEKKCLELQEKLNVPKVHCCVQIKQDGSNERIVSYIQEPNYVTKLALMDKSIMGGWMAAEELRMMHQLKDHSHSLTYGDAYECEVYKLGVTKFCQNLIVFATDQFKKK